MVRLAAICLVLALPLAACGAPDDAGVLRGKATRATAPVAKADRTAVTGGGARFGWRLVGAVEPDAGNVVLAPYSISQANESDALPIRTTHVCARFRWSLQRPSGAFGSSRSLPAT